MQEFFDRLDRIGEDVSFSNIFALTVEHSRNTAFQLIEEKTVKSITYFDFHATVKSTASAIERTLNAETIGGFVGILMENSPNWAVIFWALLMSGRKPLLINTSATPGEIAEILLTAGATTIISDTEFHADLIDSFIAADLVGQGETQFTPNFADQIAFCTSGTTGKQKICVFNAGNIAAQLTAAGVIPELSPDVMYPTSAGELKILALLPFYHIFGFVSVFLWYLFFGKTIVFLQNLAPQTILSTCRRLKVSHIYAVPIFWNAVQKLIEEKARERGGAGPGLSKILAQCTDFSRGLNIASERVVSKHFIDKIKKRTFGFNIRFMISGGGYIAPKTLSVINAIGFPLHNGYGLTEAGITSVNLSSTQAERIDGNIGAPLFGIGYKILKESSELTTGNLGVKGGQVCSGFMENGVFVPQKSEWFDTGDIVRQNKSGSYYIIGRADDVIKTAAGEKIIPDEVEFYFSKIGGVSNCALMQASEKLVLVIEVLENSANLDEIKRQFDALNGALPFYKQVNDVLLSSSPLPTALGIKLKRADIAKMYFDGEFSLLGKYERAGDDPFENVPEAVKKTVRAQFGRTLAMPASEISSDADFITQLGGDSLSYLSLCLSLEQTTGVKIEPRYYSALKTVRDFCVYINLYNGGNNEKVK